MQRDDAGKYCRHPGRGGGGWDDGGSEDEVNGWERDLEGETIAPYRSNSLFKIEKKAA